MSLPSRGAWIEMIWSNWSAERSFSRSPHGERGLKSQCRDRVLHSGVVAPLTGSVDWNPHSHWQSHMGRPSLPSRGVWIEILETICNAFAQSSRSAWTLVDGTVRYQCESPANTTASVVLPNDFKLTAANMAKYSPKSQDGVIMIHLGSGSYTFG